jgi:hypothetical protein
MLADEIGHGRLDAAETEIHRILFQKSLGEMERLSIPLPGQPIDHDPAGVPQTQELGHLVESFTGGVIPCTTEQVPPSVRIDDVKRRMTSGNDETHKSTAQGLCSHERRLHVPFEVIHGDQGDLQCIRHGLGRTEPHQQRPHQARTSGHRNGVQLVPLEPGSLQSLLHHDEDGLYVLARCQLRNHSAVRAVDGDLAGHHVGQDGPAVFNDCSGCFVAGRFDSQYQHEGSLAGMKDSPELMAP